MSTFTTNQILLLMLIALPIKKIANNTGKTYDNLIRSFKENYNQTRIKVEFTHRWRNSSIGTLIVKYGLIKRATIECQQQAATL
jgi:hypothetical protein